MRRSKLPCLGTFLQLRHAIQARRNAWHRMQATCQQGDAMFGLPHETAMRRDRVMPRLRVDLKAGARRRDQPARVGSSSVHPWTLAPANTFTEPGRHGTRVERRAEIGRWLAPIGIS
jgi:hypothetical protein